MAINSSTFMKDIFSYFKEDLKSNITDPILSVRRGDSEFVVTSYPKRDPQYPLVTLKITNLEARRAGMQTTAVDMTIDLEVRIWARNEKEKDSIYQDILNRLKNIQFTATTGSVFEGLHDFNILSSTEVDEDGAEGIKSRIVQVQYKYYNPQ